ncbi:MAG: integrase [Sphingobacteriales bacterium]|nr:integrase [Sphingobacteriales bacterium]
MKINEELSVLFWLYKSKQTKDGMSPIYVRITVNGVREDFSSGKKINVTDWDTKNGKALSTCAEAKAINSYIRKTEAQLEKHFERLKITIPEVTPKMVKDMYLPLQTNKKTLIQACRFHNELFADLVKKKKGSPISLMRYERMQRKLESFLKLKLKINDLALEGIEHSLAEQFYHYLLMTDLGENMAFKYVKILKQVIKKVVDHGWIKYNPIGGFKCPYKDPDREYLEMDELISLYNKVITIPRLMEVRDVYVFCCFTGYAYETVYSLRNEHVYKGLDNRFWISKDRSKTDTDETVPLLPIPLEIIEKYKAHPYCVKSGKLLPVNSNQRYNGYLKEVAAVCGINKHLTTHTARHTFATTVTLENDVPLETVSKMLGHKSIRTTQIYAKITKRKMSNNMQALQDKLFCEKGLLKKSL